MRRGVTSQSMAITNKNGCACVCHGSEPVIDIIGIIAITDSIHVLPDAVMVCFSLKPTSFPDQCGVWLNSDVAFGLILMWRLA